MAWLDFGERGVNTDRVQRWAMVDEENTGKADSHGQLTTTPTGRKVVSLIFGRIDKGTWDGLLLNFEESEQFLNHVHSGTHQK